ncbi:MAG: hypothetical protein ACFFAH_00155 [Promethearchaeota archaeon]
MEKVNSQKWKSFNLFLYYSLIFCLGIYLRWMRLDYLTNNVNIIGGDELYYSWGVKDLLLGNYTSWREPLFIVILAMPCFIFGYSLFICRLTSFFIGVIFLISGTWIAYRISNKNHMITLLVLFFLSIDYLLVYYSGRLLRDQFYGILAALYFLKVFFNKEKIKKKRDYVIISILTISLMLTIYSQTLVLIILTIFYLILSKKVINKNSESMVDENEIVFKISKTKSKSNSIDKKLLISILIPGILTYLAFITYCYFRFGGMWDITNRALVYNILYGNHLDYYDMNYRQWPSFFDYLNEHKLYIHFSFFIIGFINLFMTLERWISAVCSTFFLAGLFLLLIRRNLKILFLLIFIFLSQSLFFYYSNSLYRTLFLVYPLIYYTIAFFIVNFYKTYQEKKIIIEIPKLNKLNTYLSQRSSAFNDEFKIILNSRLLIWLILFIHIIILLPKHNEFSRFDFPLLKLHFAFLFIELIIIDISISSIFSKEWLKENIYYILPWLTLFIVASIYYLYLFVEF